MGASCLAPCQTVQARSARAYICPGTEAPASCHHPYKPKVGHPKSKKEEWRTPSTSVIPSEQGISLRLRALNYSGGLRYAAPWRKSPAEGMGCEKTMRMGTKMAPAPGVKGTATSTRVPSGY